MTRFRFGFSGNAFGGIDELIDVAIRAERVGFDVITVADLPGGLSPLVALAAVAQATEAIRVGPFVLNSGIWNPHTVIRDLATLDRISGGRLEIAVGSGIPLPGVRELMPATRDGRFEALRRTVAAVKGSFADPGITPGYASPPRLLVAGTSDRVLRLAAEEADGFIIAGVPPVPKVTLPTGHLVLPERTATEEYLERLRGYVGDRDDGFEVGIGCLAVLTDDVEASTAEYAAIHSYMSPEQVVASPKLVIGDAAGIADQILERGRNLGITFQNLRGATPEELQPVIEQVTGAVGV